MFFPEIHNYYRLTNWNLPKTIKAIKEMLLRNMGNKLVGSHESCPSQVTSRGLMAHPGTP